jgi:hypothetical protein
MGYFYVKVIEARKVAMRTSFYVNYPFVRLIFNKSEKKNTNFRPGIECKVWRSRNSSASLILQARDKGLHVFGSDWVGEIEINVMEYSDGNVHQKWLKLGKGYKHHSRAPRGYIHLAFQYVERLDVGSRPFASSPVEKIQSFEEYLADGYDGPSYGVDYKASLGVNSPEPKRKSASESPRIKSSHEPSDTQNSSSMRGSNEDLNATVDHSDGGSDSRSSSFDEYCPKSRTGDLISFDDVKTTPSMIDGMFPPFPTSQPNHGNGTEIQPDFANFSELEKNGYIGSSSAYVTPNNAAPFQTVSN